MPNLKELILKPLYETRLISHYDGSIHIEFEESREEEVLSYIQSWCTEQLTNKRVLTEFYASQAAQKATQTMPVSSTATVDDTGSQKQLSLDSISSETNTSNQHGQKE